MCALNASSGDNVLAISPVTWLTRGEGSPRREGVSDCIVSWDFDRKSMKFGWADMAIQMV